MDPKSWRKLRSNGGAKYEWLVEFEDFVDVVRAWSAKFGKVHWLNATD